MTKYKYKRSIGKNAILNVINNVVNILFLLITFPYVSRILSVKSIGAYNFSNSIATYFILIGALGINTYAIREGVKYRSNKSQFNQFVSEIFTINICSTVFAYALLLLCCLFFTQLYLYRICIFVISLQIVFATISVQWVFQIYEDYLYITVRNIISSLISLILLFLLVRKPYDYLNYAIVSVSAYIFSGILDFWGSKKYCRLNITIHFNLKKHIVPILIIFGINMAQMIYVNSDITILGLLKNNYIVGIYGISTKIYQFIKTIIAAVLIVTVPRMVILLEKKDFIKFKSTLSRLTKVLILLVLPASVGLFMLAKEVILIISGSKYLNAIASLRILCFAYVFSILTWVLTDCVLIPAKKEKDVFISTIISTILNIILNLIMIPFGNEKAAAVTTVLAEICVFGINYYYSRKMIKKVFISRSFFLTFMSSIIGCIGIVGVCLFCDYIFQSVILKTTFSVLISIIVYSIILLILKNEIAILIFKRIKNYFMSNI